MRDKNRYFLRITCNIQKSIKLDDYTYRILENYRGNNFSEKIRNYVYDSETNRKK